MSTLMSTINSRLTSQQPTAKTFPELPNVTQNLPDKTIENQEYAAYQKTPKLQQLIRTQYGYVGAWLTMIPELAPILIGGALAGWDQARMDGAIMQTQWWKTTTQAQRNWQNLVATDPTEAQQQIFQMSQNVRATMLSIGLSIPAATLKSFAQRAIEFNWTSNTIEQVMRQTYYTGAATEPSQGQAATFADQARQLAGEYAIRLTTSQLSRYVAENKFGTLSAYGLQALFAKQAMTMYPWMKTALQAGVTPSQFLSQYATAAGQTLGIDPSSVLWSTPKWTRALLTDQTGKSTNTPVNVGIFQQNLMRTSAFGYAKTQGARDAAYSMADQILTQFGKVAA